MYYDSDADPSAARRPDRRRSSATAARATPTRSTSRTAASTCVVGLEPGLARAGRSPSRPGLAVADVADAVQAGRRHHDPASRTQTQKAVYDADDRAEPAPGQDADVRPRLQHPLRADRAARRASTSAMVAPKGPGHLRARGLRRAAACRRSSPSTRTRAARRARERAGLRPGIGAHARRRPRDDLHGGDRDRPVRRAGAALRRRLGADQGRLRDAGRGRLPARAGLLRDACTSSS